MAKTKGLIRYRVSAQLFWAYAFHICKKQVFSLQGSYFFMLYAAMANHPLIGGNFVNVITGHHRRQLNQACNLFMPPTLKKWGAYCFRLVPASVRLSVQKFFKARVFIAPAYSKVRYRGSTFRPFVRSFVRPSVRPSTIYVKVLTL